MWQSLPQFGTAVLYAVLVAAAYTFTTALASASGRPRLLQAARLGAFGTFSMVGLAVLVLAYAFVSHDFRLSYVSRYSDRSMSVPFQVAALWGGQDGSLLWWLFLTSLFGAAAVVWLKHRYVELQPYVLATLMTVIGFFGVLMIFAANPFWLNPTGAPADGAGLNYQLRNFYMIIHPPSLYVGFTSCAVCFSFAMAALITGRLDTEWIVATRKWMLFSWAFLSIGNVLGMMWAYEELGWGGPWAWDPVENAAFLPWLSATAYVHSVMIQERRGMLKVWNVVLICLTFFLTIFGTWLTRSGLISSVHSFAQSGVGIYFVWYMAFLLAGMTALVVWRLPLLRSEGGLESVLSRETAFVVNNWGLLSLAVFILVATVWPRISEWLLDGKSTLGPTFYNAWLPIGALLVLFLMGAAPLLGWRKTSPELFRKSFTVPVGFAALVGALHLAFGQRLGMPPFVTPEPIYEGGFGDGLAKVGSTFPFLTVVIVAWNLAVVTQEYARGVGARIRNQKEAAHTALWNLVSKSRRRYGGYVVHVGIAVMFLGFAGRAWGVEREASMMPGDTLQIEEYTVTYVGPRMEVDTEKRMIFADVEVARHGRPVGRISPAKFIYTATPGQPSTEVARHITVRDDLYATIGMVSPATKLAALHFHVNVLISFIWFGAAIVLLGATVCLWPDVSLGEERVWSWARAAGSVTASVIFAFLLASGIASPTYVRAPRAAPSAQAAEEARAWLAVPASEAR